MKRAAAAGAAAVGESDYFSGCAHRPRHVAARGRPTARPESPEAALARSAKKLGKSAPSTPGAPDRVLQTGSSRPGPPDRVLQTGTRKPGGSSSSRGCWERMGSVARAAGARWSLDDREVRGAHGAGGRSFVRWADFDEKTAKAVPHRAPSRGTEPRSRPRSPCSGADRERSSFLSAQCSADWGVRFRALAFDCMRFPPVVRFWRLWSARPLPGKTQVGEQPGRR